MSESTGSNSVGVQPSTTSQSSSTSSRSSRESSRSEGSKRSGKKVYDNVDGAAKSPNSKADARGPVTKVKHGHGGDDTKVYPGMTLGYAQGPGRENYDEGQYANDGVNAFYERRTQDGLDLPD